MIAAFAFDLINVLAEATAPAAPGGGEVPGAMNPIVMVAIFMVMFYFLFIRPNKQRENARVKMMNELKNGDWIVSDGGIHGMITNKGEDTVTVKIAEGVKIKLEKTSIGRVTKKSADADTEVPQTAAIEEKPNGTAK